MVREFESPSSFNTYMMCPRKYYWSYVIGISTRDSIALIRGSMVHKVLENLWEDKDKFDYSHPEKLIESMTGILQGKFSATWRRTRKIKNLGLSPEIIQETYDDSMNMMKNFSVDVVTEMVERYPDMDLRDAVSQHTPEVEVWMRSPSLGVRGSADVIRFDGEDIEIIDYKTSKKTSVTKDNKLQLGIYALLYEETNGKLPKRVGIHFVKKENGLKWVEVTPEFIEDTKKQILELRKKMESDNIEDYPYKRSPLCKWSTGECDFYKICSREWEMERRMKDLMQGITDANPLPKVTDKQEMIVRQTALKAVVETINSRQVNFETETDMLNKIAELTDDVFDIIVTPKWQRKD